MEARFRAEDCGVGFGLRDKNSRFRDVAEISGKAWVSPPPSNGYHNGVL